MSRVREETWRTFCMDPSEAAFARLYDETSPLVYTICLRILRDATDAADAFQTVYCRLVAAAKHTPQARAVECIEEAVCRLAVREADALRHRRARHARREAIMDIDHVGVNGTPSAGDLVERRQLRERVEAVVGALPEKYRLPVLLHYFDGLTHDEVSAALGLTRSTISNRIARALRRLEPPMRRAGLGGTAVVLATIATSQTLAAPPSALTAPLVFAKASEFAAAAGAGAASSAALTAAATNESAAIGASAATGWGFLASAAAVGSVAVLLGVGVILAITAARKTEEKPAAVSPLPVVAANDPTAPQTPGGAEEVGTSEEKRPGGVAPGTTSVFGRITIAETGKPASGATVLLLPSARRGTADADGVFEIANVAPEAAYVVAYSGPYVSHLRQEDVGITTMTGGVRNGPCDLALRRGLVLRGRVTAAETGEPVAGAKITVRLIDERITGSAADGTYALEGLPAMLIGMDVRARGFGRARANVEPVEGGDNVCNLELDPEGTVAVLVTDAGDKPIAGARISLLPGTSSSGWSEDALTGPDGRLHVGEVSVRNPPRLAATRAGYELVEEVRPHFEDGARDATVKLVLRPKAPAAAKTGAFAGRVTDASGKPVADATVSWGSTTARTDAEGRYRLAVSAEEATTAADRELCVAARGFAPEWRPGAPPGTAAEPAVADFTLEPGHWLEVSVVGPVGEPLPRVFVHASRAEGDPSDRLEIPGQPLRWEARATDASGRLRMESLPAGRVRLELWRTGLTDRRDCFGEVDAEQTITMKLAGAIRGRVVDRETNGAVREFVVKVEGGGVSVSRSTGGQRVASVDGRFRLGDLNQEQAYRVAVEAAGYPPFSQDGVVARAPDSDEEELLAIGKGTLVSGAIVDATTGRAIAGATVFAAVPEYGILDWGRLEGDLDERRQSVTRTQTDADGLFSLEEGDDRKTLFVTAEGRERVIVSPESRVVRAGPTGGRMTIRLRAGASVKGVVVRGATPVSDVRLHVTHLGVSGYVLERVRTGADGSFRLSNLAAGFYRVGVYHKKGNREFSGLSRTIEVAAGEEKTVAIGADLGTCVLRGRVVDAQGRSVAGAHVAARPAFECAYGEFNDYTDSAGAYAIECLLPGAYKAAVTKRDDASSSYREERSSAELDVRGVVEHTFAFAAKHTVAARIRNNAAGRNTLSTAYLYAVNRPENSNSDDGSEREGRCRIADGRVAFHGLFKGTYRIQIEGETTPGCHGRIAIPSRFELDTTAGDEDLGEIVVPAPGLFALNGNVVDAAGGPLARAAIAVTPTSRRPFIRFVSTADGEGRFRIEGLAAGTYEVRVQRNSGVSRVAAEIRETLAIDADLSHTFRMPAAYSVMARLALVDATAGVAMTGANLEAIGWDRRNPCAPDGTRLRQSSEVEDGRVCFAGPLRGDYALSLGLLAGDRFMQMTLPRTFALDTTGGDQDLGDIEVPFAGTGSVHVSCDALKGPDSRIVYLFAAGNLTSPIVTASSSEGVDFDLRPIPPGSYDVAVASPGFMSDPPIARAIVEPGQAAPSLAFALTPRAAISGNIVAGDGSFRPAPIRRIKLTGARVARELEAAPGDCTYDIVLGQHDRACGSSFVFVNLDAGSYSIAVDADGFEPLTQTIAVETGRVVYLQFELVPAAE